MFRIILITNYGIKWNLGIYKNMLLSKKCDFQCFWGFAARAEMSWPRTLAMVWGVILQSIFKLGHKEIYDSMIPSLLKPGLRQIPYCGRLESICLDLCRENALDWCNANKFINKDGIISTKGWESSHNQAFIRFPSQFIVSS